MTNVSAYTLLLPALPHVQEAEPRMEPAEKLPAAAWADAQADLARLAGALGIARERQEDVLQDVYLAAREKCPAGLADGELRRWLFRVTANRCRLEHRKRSRWKRVFEALTFWRDTWENATASGAVETSELTIRVEAALSRLNTMEREIVVLRYFCDFDSTEIGEMLSIPAATVRSRLAHARRQLARDLADWK